MLRALLRPAARKMAELALPRAERAGGHLGTVLETVRKARLHPLERPVLDPIYSPVQPHERSTIEILRAELALRRRGSQIEAMMELLEDQRSRTLLSALLAYRHLGPAYVTLPVDPKTKLHNHDKARSHHVGPSRFDFPPMEMVEYRVGDIDVECWLLNVSAGFYERQYFFERDGVRIMPETGDTIIDAGACFGDTALVFADAVGPDGAVHSFEPLPRQQQVFRANLDRNPRLAERIRVHAYALSGTTGERLHFSDGGAGARADNGGAVEVVTTTLDDFVERHGIAPTFIKMDIEGAEPAALKGAARTLRQHRPKLAISIYHSLDDLLTIAPLIRSMEPSYRFYLDHHTVHSEETILYAVAG